MLKLFLVLIAGLVGCASSQMNMASNEGKLHTSRNHAGLGTRLDSFRNLSGGPNVIVFINHPDRNGKTEKLVDMIIRVLRPNYVPGDFRGHPMLCSIEVVGIGQDGNAGYGFEVRCGNHHALLSGNGIVSVRGVYAKHGDELNHQIHRIPQLLNEALKDVQ